MEVHTHTHLVGEGGGWGRWVVSEREEVRGEERREGRRGREGGTGRRVREEVRGEGRPRRVREELSKG